MYKENGALLFLVVQPDISSTPQQLPTSAPNYPATQMGALAPQQDQIPAQGQGIDRGRLHSRLYMMLTPRQTDPPPPQKKKIK